MSSNVMVSIIIATYNAEEYLERCLKNIVNQSYKYKEIIIIDGGSTDKTLSIIEDYQNSISYWHSKADNGIYDAWNSGIQKSKGEWLCFLGADDYFIDSEVIRNMMSFIDKTNDKKILLFYGNVNFTTTDGKLIDNLNTNEDVVNRLSGNFIFHSGSFHHREIFINYGLWPTRYKICGDRALLTQVFLDEKALLLPNITTINYQFGGISGNLNSEIDKTKERIKSLNEYGAKKKYILKIYFELILYQAMKILTPIISETTIKKLRNYYRIFRKRPVIY